MVKTITLLRSAFVLSDNIPTCTYINILQDAFTLASAWYELYIYSCIRQTLKIQKITQKLYLNLYTRKFVNSTKEAKFNKYWVRVWKGIHEIRDFTKKRYRIQDLTAPGKKDLSKLGMGCGVVITKERGMWDFHRKGMGLWVRTPFHTLLGLSPTNSRPVTRDAINAFTHTHYTSLRIGKNISCTCITVTTG